jgi:hypothetical protein
MPCRFCEKTRQLAQARRARLATCATALPARRRLRSIEQLEIVIEHASNGERVWINADRACAGRGIGSNMC